MSKTSPGLSKRLGVGLLAAALSLFGIALAGPVAAQDADDPDRLAGATRFGTAAAVATEAYPDGCATVVIATGMNFPDALAASGLAGSLDAPILLVGTDDIPAETEAALGDDGCAATDATIVGGTAAVSQDVQDELEDMGLTVDRVAGDDRYETAADVAGELGDYDRAIVASGEVAPDALAAGPIAADTESGPSPILLVTQNDVPAPTSEALAGVGEVVVVGGTARISDATEAEAQDASDDTDAERVAGLNRQETAVDIAEWEQENLGWEPTAVLLAGPRAPSGPIDFAPDALVGGPLGGLLDAPILITVDADTLGPAGDFIEANEATIDRVIGLGGTAVLADELLVLAEEAAGEGPPAANADFPVDPSGDEVIEIDPDDPEASSRQFTFEVGDSDVSVALVDCDNVTTDSNGVVSFADANDDDEADLGGTNGEIEVLQGVAQADGTEQVDEVSPSNGDINVTVNAEEGGCFAIVVWEDTDGDGDLDLDENDEPTEPFGVSGNLFYLPEEAEAGSDTDQAQVSFVDKTNDLFTAGNDDDELDGDDFTYEYDANDNYYIDPYEDEDFDGDDDSDETDQATQAEFEAALSKGDTIRVDDYQTNEELESTFIITRDNPAPPAVSSEEVDDDTVSFDAEPTDPSYELMAGSDSLIVARAEIDVESNAEDDTECSIADVLADPDQVEEDDFELVAAMTKAQEAAGEDGDADGVFSFELADQPAGCYVYIVTAVVDGDIGAPSFVNELGVDSAPIPLEIEGEGDSSDPTITDARVEEEGGSLDTVLDTGDVVQLTFSEEMDSNGSERFIVTDADGDRYQISCAGDDVDCNYVFADPDDAADAEAPANGDMLIISFIDDGSGGARIEGVTDLNSEVGDNDPSWPATIVSTTNVTDTAGNPVDLAESDDVVIDDEGALDDDTADNPFGP